MGWFRRNEHDEEQLSAYLDGELNARQTENVEQHLSTCDTCTALLEELRETRALLSTLPAQTPPRSFVLGAEYAREPVRDVAPPPKRFNLALAPAVALSVFVALLFVDLGDFSSTSSDESTSGFTAATSRQAADTDGVATDVAGPAGVPSAAESAADASAGGASAGNSAGAGTEPAIAPGTSEGAAGSVAASPEAPPAALSAEAAPTAEDDGESATKASGGAAQQEEASPEPLAFDAPDADDGDGVSTLRLLQVLAGAAFLASGFYVFVWPRITRGGSD